MRRLVFSVVGLLGLLCTAIFVMLGFLVPSPSEVDRTTAKAEKVADRTGEQVSLLRDQIRTVRRPELMQRTRELSEQLPQVTTLVRERDVDSESIRSLNRSLGDVADGADGMADALDPKGLGQMKTSVGKTAALLDEKVVPAAERSADRLDRVSAGLKTDAERLSKLLREAPPDLKAAREVHDSLARLNDGIDQVSLLIKEERLQAMRDGFKGMEQSLNSGADEVDKLARQTYPVVTFNGLKPNVEQKPFWPEGDKIADGMRKGAKGITAAGKELDELAKELPHMRQALEESRKVSNKTREALAKAIKEQAQLEAVLKNIPEHTARLAKELPAITGDLSKVLRETAQLKEVAVALRQTEKGMETAMEKWPVLQNGLRKSAGVLRMTQAQLEKTLANQEKHRAVLDRTLDLADVLAKLLPLYLEQLDRHLAEQERSLAGLEESLDEIRQTIPVWGETTRRVVILLRVGLWTFAGIFLLLGGYACSIGFRRTVVVALPVVGVPQDATAVFASTQLPSGRGPSGGE